ncbi:MAG: Two component transcriptional regulator, winged helix family [Parcubacteria group bacterium GW2011_GWD2_38_12]|nr:MAG: Two component transcriptional regulator, winged helix family [Parcubacteria group bacterium GW2011_GWD2_38_12]
MKNKIKIVLVEDDQFLSKILILRLVEEGFDVVLADNGQDAAGVIKKENPNIVLLDLLLPKKNGFEVLEEIKLDAKINQIPVIILSNLGQQTDINKGLKLGATDYLVKANFGIKDIVSKIKEHLAKI